MNHLTGQLWWRKVCNRNMSAEERISCELLWLLFLRTFSSAVVSLNLGRKEKLLRIVSDSVRSRTFSHWVFTDTYFFFMTQSADRHKHTDVRTRSLLIWSSCLCCYCEVITQIWVSLARSLCFLISSLVSFTTMRKHLTTIHHLHGEIQTRKSCQGKQGLEKLFCLPVDRVVDLTLQTVS